MKIYEARTAPNPRLVRIFLAEKGIDIEYVELDIATGENHTHLQVWYSEVSNRPSATA